MHLWRMVVYSKRLIMLTLFVLCYSQCSYSASSFYQEDFIKGQEVYLGGTVKYVSKSLMVFPLAENSGSAGFMYKYILPAISQRLPTLLIRPSNNITHQVLDDTHNRITINNHVLSGSLREVAGLLYNGRAAYDGDPLSTRGAQIVLSGPYVSQMEAVIKAGYSIGGISSLRLRSTEAIGCIPGNLIYTGNYYVPCSDGSKIPAVARSGSFIGSVLSEAHMLTKVTKICLSANVPSSCNSGVINVAVARPSTSGTRYYYSGADDLSTKECKASKYCIIGVPTTQSYNVSHMRRKISLYARSAAGQIKTPVRNDVHSRKRRGTTCGVPVVTALEIFFTGEDGCDEDNTDDIAANRRSIRKLADVAADTSKVVDLLKISHSNQLKVNEKFDISISSLQRNDELQVKLNRHFTSRITSVYNYAEDVKKTLSDGIQTLAEYMRETGTDLRGNIQTLYDGTKDLSLRSLADVYVDVVFTQVNNAILDDREFSYHQTYHNLIFTTANGTLSLTLATYKIMHNSTYVGFRISCTLMSFCRKGVLFTPDALCYYSTRTNIVMYINSYFTDENGKIQSFVRPSVKPAIYKTSKCPEVILTPNGAMTTKSIGKPSGSTFPGGLIDNPCEYSKGKGPLSKMLNCYKNATALESKVSVVDTRLGALVKDASQLMNLNISSAKTLNLNLTVDNSRVEKRNDDLLNQMDKSVGDSRSYVDEQNLEVDRVKGITTESINLIDKINARIKRNADSAREHVKSEIKKSKTSDALILAAISLALHPALFVFTILLHRRADASFLCDGSFEADTEDNVLLFDIIVTHAALFAFLFTIYKERKNSVIQGFILSSGAIAYNYKDLMPKITDIAIIPSYITSGLIVLSKVLVAAGDDNSNLSTCAALSAMKLWLSCVKLFLVLSMITMTIANIRGNYSTLPSSLSNRFLKAQQLDRLCIKIKELIQVGIRNPGYSTATGVVALATAAESFIIPTDSAGTTSVSPSLQQTTNAATYVSAYGPIVIGVLIASSAVILLDILILLFICFCFRRTQSTLVNLMEDVRVNSSKQEFNSTTCSVEKLSSYKNILVAEITGKFIVSGEEQEKTIRVTFAAFDSEHVLNDLKLPSTSVGLRFNYSDVTLVIHPIIPGIKCCKDVAMKGSRRMELLINNKTVLTQLKSVSSCILCDRHETIRDVDITEAKDRSPTDYIRSKQVGLGARLQGIRESRRGRVTWASENRGGAY